jgi:hypothetical protein
VEVDLLDYVGDVGVGEHLLLEGTSEAPKLSQIRCNTHFLRMIKFCRSNSALGCILKINSIG